MPRLVVSQFGDTTPRFRSKVEPVVEMIMRFPLVERNRSERMDERRGCVLLGDNDAVDADRHQIRAVNYQRVLAGDDVAGQHVDDAARQVAIAGLATTSSSSHPVAQGREYLRRIPGLTTGLVSSPARAVGRRRSR